MTPAAVSIVAVLLSLLLYFAVLRPSPRKHQHHQPAPLVKLALLLLLATASMQTKPAQPVLPPAPDERRKQTPPTGVPIAAGPDAGTDRDGGTGAMLAAPAPDTRMAGEAMAVDYDATSDYVMGAPLTR